MKVAELIEILSGIDQTADVRLAYNSGDYWGTILTPLVGEVSVEAVTYCNRVGFKLATEDSKSILDGDVAAFYAVVIK